MCRLLWICKESDDDPFDDSYDIHCKDSRVRALRDCTMRAAVLTTISAFAALVGLYNCATETRVCPLEFPISRGILVDSTSIRYYCAASRTSSAEEENTFVVHPTPEAPFGHNHASGPLVPATFVPCRDIKLWRWTAVGLWALALVFIVVCCIATRLETARSRLLLSSVATPE